MRLGDAGGDAGEGVDRRLLSLAYGQWSVDPDTGILSVSEAALSRFINTDPIDKWYILDPEPIA
ncbi:hypothetical protein SK128_011343, partial [Halocaridina rubra]